MTHSLEYKMYRCLQSYPCRCTKRWEKDALKTVLECQRCKLVRRYEEEVLALEGQA